MTYVFRCPRCGDQAESRDHRGGEYAPVCVHDGPTGHSVFTMKRDYRTENAGVQTLQLKRERERGGSSAVRDMFLPTAKDFAGPGDPDGSKGIRQWNDEHDPKPGNKHPNRPVGPRKVW